MLACLVGPCFTTVTLSMLELPWLGGLGRCSGVIMISTSPHPSPGPVSVSPVHLASLSPLGLEDLWRPPARSSTVVPSDTPGRTTFSTNRRSASVSLSAGETIGKHTLTSPIKTSRNPIILRGTPGDSTGSVPLLTMSVI